MSGLVRNRNSAIFDQKRTASKKIRLDGRKNGRDQDFRDFPKYS